MLNKAATTTGKYLGSERHHIGLASNVKRNQSLNANRFKFCQRP